MSPQILGCPRGPFYTGSIGLFGERVHDIWSWRRAYLSGFARCVAVSSAESARVSRKAVSAPRIGRVKAVGRRDLATDGAQPARLKPRPRAQRLLPQPNPTL